ncbi:MAG: PhoU domain-containing protein [Phycisphaerales bacterium]|jgi:phosphate transport system protein|nr:PhoU domain-containing protein [Phycisphaerales bacterium]
MPTRTDISERLSRLRGELGAQGRRVQALVEGAFDASFARDGEAAARVIAQDDEIDRVDVAIERTAVTLLSDLARESVEVDEKDLRWLLTIVKVNNEMERIADLGVAIAEAAIDADRAAREEASQGHPPADSGGTSALASSLRVLTNSVIGIVRDAVSAVERGDAGLAMLVLRSHHAVDRFRAEVATHIQRRMEGEEAGRPLGIQRALRLHEMSGRAAMIADHCTNTAEQVVYVASGMIVRHTEGGWVSQGPDGRAC